MNAFRIFATMSLVDAISRPLAAIRRALGNTEGAADRLSARLGRLATGLGKAALPAAVFLGSLGAMTGEAIAFESKMADVAKVVDFESPAELEGMSRALQDLSLQIPIAAEGFADITAAAAQSGVAKNDLIDFSVQAAKMGVAFDVAAGDASKTMADWRAGMGLTLQETYSLADAVNHLANNMNATAVTAFAAKVQLVFQGVLSVFKTLQNGRGELSADLAEKIEAAGLMGLVTTVGRVVYRVLAFFKSLAAGIRVTVQPALSRLGEAFRLVANTVRPLFGYFTRLGNSLSTAAGQTDAMPWRVWGQVVGELAGGALSWFIDVVGWLVMVLGGLVSAVSTVYGWLSRLGAKFGDALFAAVSFASGVIASVSNFAASISGGVSMAIETISNFSLVEAGLGLINGFADGIKAGAENLVKAVSGVLQRVRAYLPFSDAQTGPLSNLTASGMAFISTFADGIMARAETLVSAVSGVLDKVRSYLPFSDAKAGPLSSLTASGMAIPGTLAEGVASGAPRLVSAADAMFSQMNLAPPYYEMPAGFGGAGFAAGRIPLPSFNLQEGGQIQAAPFERPGQAGGRTVHLHIGKIELPNVVDADGFVAGLEAIIDERFDV